MKEKYNEKNLKNAVKNSNSIADVLRKLNTPVKSGNYKTINKYIKKYNIDISHFTGQGWNKGENFIKFNKTIPMDEILIKDSTYTNTKCLKERLVKDNLLLYKCDECGNEGEYNNKTLTLQLDHINGINDDNRIENLRLLCPNCHSQTDTYCGKRFKKEYFCSCGNKKHKKSEKCFKCSYINRKYTKKKTNKKEVKIKNCKCGKVINKRSKQCSECSKIKQRKVERPSLEQLSKDIKETNYTQTGRKYGVSDNTIRKWIKNYENKPC